MRDKDTIYYKNNQVYKIDFSSEEISSDASVYLADKIERNHKIIRNISDCLIERRKENLVKHSIYKILKQRVYLMMHGYEDANDAEHLKHDPILQDVLEGSLASQPTVSRFENSIDKHSLYKILSKWLENYVKSIGKRKKVIIDVDCTDDPTHGHQQLSLFNGYYGQFMYNELLFHDGQTGQLILPVLRPGNSHSNRWYVAILKRIVKRIRTEYPDIKIYIRADSGFSNSFFYKLAYQEHLYYAIGLITNDVLKKRVERAERAVRILYGSKNQKHQHFISYQYQAGTWHSPLQCYAKIESTGKGMNIRHFCSNIPEQQAREIYFGFYVKRGDTSENRIKELKNMCFADRLSDHGFWANFIRLIISCLVYEMFLKIKEMIRKTKHEAAKKWQVNNIRLYLLKVGGTIKKTVKRVYVKLSKSFVYKDLLYELIAQ